MRRPTSILALLLAFVWLTLPLAASALSFTGMVEFGDSLSDVGNVGPPPPYYNGRYSNGPIWVDDLSSSLGLGAVTASSAGGSDYAVGGATTSDLATQISSFSTAVGGVADPNALYTVWAGGNDILAILQGTSGFSTSQAAQNVADAITSLAVLGAQNFLVPNLPNIGLTPAAIQAGSSAVAYAQILSQQFNTSLAQDLAGLSGVNVYQMDVYSQLNTIVASPSSYGFTDVTDPCYDSTAGTVCATPSSYLFWDTLHPTTAAHALLGASALAIVPEPGRLVLLLLGGAIVGIRRRRSLQSA